MANKNIALIGFMGSGKTTIGIHVSYLLKRPFYDSDLEIEKMTGMSISNFFKRYGENEFRKLESQVVERLSSLQSCIIATGGGIVKNPMNMHVLKENCLVVYLHSDPVTIDNNTRNSSTRPLLEGENRLEKIHSLMTEREPIYRTYADVIVETKGRDVSVISKTILNEYEKVKIM